MRGLRGIVTIQRQTFRRLILVGLLPVLAALGLALLIGRASTPPAPSPESAAAQPALKASSPTPEVTSELTEVMPSEKAAPDSPAIADLNSLSVKGRAPRTGYVREAFGPAWADVDANGCNTRDDVLKTALTGSILDGDCTVIAGSFTDPYTATDVVFELDEGTISIDHVVALSDAWQKGAQSWPFAKRVAFANDPLELQATVGGVNQQKSDYDAASWLPPSRVHRCPFVAQQIAIKRKYDLWVTPAEKDAMMRVLTTCPDQAVPVPGPQPTMAVGPAARESTSPPADASPAPSTPAVGGGLDPDFGTCRAAKSAGFGPYASGVDPEYAYYRDADHDGTVCE